MQLARQAVALFQHRRLLVALRERNIVHRDGDLGGDRLEPLQVGLPVAARDLVQQRQHPDRAPSLSTGTAIQARLVRG